MARKKKTPQDEIDRFYIEHGEFCCGSVYSGTEGKLVPDGPTFNELRRIIMMEVDLRLANDSRPS